MKTAFQSSFARDLRSIKDQTLRDRVAELIETVEQAAALNAVPGLKRLGGRVVTTEFDSVSTGLG